jgi:hypothetical protein
MANQAQTFRIFVSSTFSDLKAERNALQASVFPRLRELCEEHHARFQPIDLRWGVSSEASLDQQAMSICLGEVDRCQKVSPRPNFIVLLGNRYGWMPPPAQIPDAEFQGILTRISVEEKAFLEEWYKLDTNAIPPEWRLKPREKGGDYEKYADWQPVEAELQRILSDAVGGLPLDILHKLVYQASATHQEILTGALEQEDAPEHVFCFFRDIPELPKTFSKSGYDEMLAARLILEYPQGLKPSCQVLVQSVQALPPQTSAKALHTYLKEEQSKVPERSDEEGVLGFMHSVLVDFVGRDFINLDEETWGVDEAAAAGLAALKDELQAKFSANMFTADGVAWQGAVLPSEARTYRMISEDHIGRLPDDLDACLPILEMGYQPRNLCEALFQSLGRVILAEVDHPHALPDEEKKVVHIQPSAVLDAEGLAHHTFAEERLTYFVGREGILKEINAYLGSAARQILAVFGEGGTGKSALMAKAAEHAQRALTEPQLVYRFIGATPGSSDGRSLLESLCKEISRCYGTAESDIPLDFRDLVPEFAKRMSLATAEKPLVLFLDSLDQLSAHQDARRLSWLPAELPDYVSLVVSSRKEKDVYQNLQAKGALEKILGGLEEGDGRLLLKQWLADVRRELTAIQEKEVISKFKDSKGNPLYLKLAFEEARLWTSFQKPQEQLAIDVAGIIKDNMIKRLTDESNHGKMLVSHALGYLAASRQGLAEDELVDLLSRDLDVYEWFFRQTYHLPSDLVNMAITHLREHPEEAANLHPESYHDAERLAIDWLKQDRTPPEPVKKFLREVLQKTDSPRLPIVLWSRLSFDLIPYLSERLVDGSALLAFYHRELGDVSKKTFLGDGKAQKFHAKLADYFRVKADPAGNRSWSGGNKHALSELPYHLISAGERDETFKLLTDFTFLEHKAEEVGITKTIDEFGREAVTSEGVQDLQKDYDLALEAFYGGIGSGGVGGGPLIRSAEEMGGKLRVYCPVCNRKSEIIGGMLGTVITCPQEDCKTKLKLNTFTIPMD